MAVSWSIYRLHLFRSRVQQRGVLVGKAPTEGAKRRKWPPRDIEIFTKVFGSYESGYRLCPTCKARFAKTPITWKRISPHPHRPFTKQTWISTLRVFHTLAHSWSHVLNLFINLFKFIKVINYDWNNIICVWNHR